MGFIQRPPNCNSHRLSCGVNQHGNRPFSPLEFVLTLTLHLPCLLPPIIYQLPSDSNIHHNLFRAIYSSQFTCQPILFYVGENRNIWKNPLQLWGECNSIHCSTCAISCSLGYSKNLIFRGSNKTYPFMAI